MGNPRGFLTLQRKKNAQREVSKRLRDWNEFDLPLPEAELRSQASRCMDCGIPFCHNGCPLGNLIPDWNDLVYRGHFDKAVDALESTNNFPEVTGRVCPAPCEASCVLALNSEAVTIKEVEKSIAERAFASGPLQAKIPPFRTGKRVAVVGSGPAGMAASQQLVRKGHSVTLFEKADRIGGLLRYGIPDFKMEKGIIDRRIDQMQREGVEFQTGVHVGVDVTGDELKANFDAIVLCGGARQPRDLQVPGRELQGVVFAMDFLTQQNRRVAGDVVPEQESIWATGKRVVILGGGDTGSDCLGTSLRQTAKEVIQLEFMPAPAEERVETNPWPEWPYIFRTSSSQEEGGKRLFALRTTELIGEHGHLTKLRAVPMEQLAGKLIDIPDEIVDIPCDLLILAIGFTGPEKEDVLNQLGVEQDPRTNVKTNRFQTNVPGVFAAGDISRGQSLVVWAIAEGRQAAIEVDNYLQNL
jgi:glutamate synthase (NADPH) small chain